MAAYMRINCEKCDRQYPATVAIEDPNKMNGYMKGLLYGAETSGWSVDYKKMECICPDCLEKEKVATNPLPEKIEWTTYLNNNKEQNYDMVEQIEKEFGIKLPEEAAQNLLYCLYEVTFNLEINPKTGEYKILSVKE